MSLQPAENPTYGEAFAAIEAAHTSGAKVAHWLMDELSGNLIDSSGNGHTLSANGTPIYDVGPLTRGTGGGGSITHDGSTDFWDIADDSDFAFTTSFTFAAWVGGNQVSQAHIAAQALAGDVAWFLKMSASRRLVFTMSLDGTALTSVSSAPFALSANGTHYVVVTFDGSTMRNYVDGVLRATTALSGSMHDSASNLFLAQREGTTNEWFGRLGDASLWNEVWTADEVRSAYFAGIRLLNSQFADEVARWDDDHGAAVFGFTADSERSVDEIAGDDLTWAGSPLFDIHGEIGTGDVFALNSDGVNDAVSAGDNAKAGSGDWWYTVAVKNIDTVSAPFMSQRNSGAQGWEIRVDGASGVFLRTYDSGATSSSTTAQTDISLDDWAILNFWRDDSLDTIYFQLNDGSVQSVATANWDVPTVDAIFAIAGERVDLGSVRKHNRIPEPDEINALYAVTRSFLFNIDGTAANNPDYTTLSAALTDYNSIVAADNLTHWWDKDDKIETATFDSILDVAFENGSETVARYAKLFTYPVAWSTGNQTIPTGKGLIKTTAAQQNRTSFILDLTSINHAHLEGFVVDCGTVGHAGVVLSSDGVACRWDSLRIIHEGDFTSPTNALALIDSKGAQELKLRNCLIEMDNDDQGGTDPGVMQSGGSVLLRFEHCTIVQRGTETGLRGKAFSNTNTIIGPGFNDIGGVGDTSVFQDTTEVTTADLTAIFGDASTFDYTIKSGSVAYQTGTPIIGQREDFEGTTWTDPDNPNCGHIDTLFVAPIGGSGMFLGIIGDGLS